MLFDNLQEAIRSKNFDLVDPKVLYRKYDIGTENIYVEVLGSGKYGTWLLVSEYVNIEWENSDLLLVPTNLYETNCIGHFLSLILFLKDIKKNDDKLISEIKRIDNLVLKLRKISLSNSISYKVRGELIDRIFLESDIEKLLNKDNLFTIELSRKFSSGIFGLSSSEVFIDSAQSKVADLLKLYTTYSDLF